MNIYSISNSMGQSYDKYDVNKKLTDAGIPADVIAKGETAIQNYAVEHGITLPESDKQDAKPEKTAANAQVASKQPKPENTGAALDTVA